MRKFYLLLIFAFCALGTQAQRHPLVAADSLGQALWVQSVLPEMSLEQKVGQLFMIQVPSGASETRLQEIETWVSEGKVGGLLFSKSEPQRVRELIVRFQKVANIPLLIAIDAEWGLAMRLTGTTAYPWNMALGAVRDTSLLYEMGAQIGRQCRSMGIHLNFAPVVDINTNPANPIIGNRSFGENPRWVTQSAAALMSGMQSEGLLTCLKHFPGHGDTSKDSHKELPYVAADRKRLDSVELYPYRALIKKGVSSVMVAHLGIPALESRPGFPSSLSRKVINGLLLGELGFKGLVITDALNMKAAANFAGKGDVELEAFLAGNDILLMPEDAERAHGRIVEAVRANELSDLRLTTSVQKILMAKARAGLNRDLASFTFSSDSPADLDLPEYEVLNELLVESSMTLVRDPLSLVPIRSLERSKVAYVGIGDRSGDVFMKQLQKYTEVTALVAEDLRGNTQLLDNYNTIIVGYHTDSRSPYAPYTFRPKDLQLLKAIAEHKGSNTLLVSFASPYALADVQFMEGLDAILCAYQNSELAQAKAAEAVFGAIEITGRLPVSIYQGEPAGTGLRRGALDRLGFSLPERVGIDSRTLARVDTLVLHGLDSAMFPGAQLLVARKGKVIYNKSFGSYTYVGERKVKEDDLYDLASLTKILATLPILMKMEEEGKIDLNDHFDELLTEFRASDLRKVTVLRALTHYGGLPAWIPFYANTLDRKKRPSRELYRYEPAEGFSVRVNENLYLMDSYRDSMYVRIADQELKSNRYRYSDVGYYVFKKYIEQIYGMSLDRLADSLLYRPMGATNTLFNPLTRVPRARIVPSEEDSYFRYSRIQGYVNDKGAAMLGGVGGHAGLFSNALDVAKIMQMYLQGGYYGGKTYLNSRTINKFNTCYFCDKNVRRGVGFDKPQLKDRGPTCGCVSRKSFGHSGFTGTYTWADPEEDIVYVFLSNRTYPSARNNLLITTELRTRIQQVIYNALLD